MRIHMSPEEEFGFIYLVRNQSEGVEKRHLNSVPPAVHPSDPAGRPAYEPSPGPTWHQVPLRDPFVDLHDLLVCNRSHT